MTWLERLSNGIKFRAIMVVAILAMIIPIIVVLVSAAYNVGQKKEAISQETLNLLISYYKDLGFLAVGFLIRTDKTGTNENNN